MMLRHMAKYFFTLVILCTLALPTYADEEPRYYSVEIILIENTDTANREAEALARSNTSASNQQSADSANDEPRHELGTPFPLKARSGYKPELMFTPLNKYNLQLTQDAQKIQKSHSRRVLLHTGWIQPGLSADKAVRVHFKKELAKSANNGNNQADYNLNQLSENPYVEGGIKVILSRYLHVDADITYYAGESTTTTTANPDDMNGEAQPVTKTIPRLYHMKQLRRRMRSTELHYLDHPVVSMLVLITPYEVPAAQ